MIFYDCATAPSPRRVRIYLAEKGIEVPTEQVDLASGQQFTDDYRKLNPLGTVPTLKLDDGTCIGDIMGICRYFEALHPDPPLFGSDPREIALVEMWSRRAEAEGTGSIRDVFRNASKGLVDKAVPGVVEPTPQIPGLVDRGKAALLRFYKMMNEQLKDKEFVIGDRYTVADITAQVAMDFSRAARTPMPEEHEHLGRWHKAVSARPSAAL
jgi:glutathione S-transferase